MDVAGPIGSEGNYKLEYLTEQKKFKFSVGYDGKGVDGEISLYLEPDYFLDKLKEAIPGKVDDTVIDLLKAAFLK
jgi:hypothetical protein